MSDSVIIPAIIAILAALIGGFAVIIARPHSSGGTQTIYIVGFVATIFAAIGFIGGLIFTRNSSNASPTMIPTQTAIVITATPSNAQSQPTNDVTAAPADGRIKVCQPTKTGMGQSMFLNISVPSGYVQYLGGSRFDNVSDGVFVTITGPYSSTHELFQGAFCEPVVIGSPEDTAAKAQIEREVRFGGVACDLGDCPIEVKLP